MSIACESLRTRQACFVTSCAGGGAEYAKSREAKERALKEAQEAKERERLMQRQRMAEVRSPANPMSTDVGLRISALHFHKGMYCGVPSSQQAMKQRGGGVGGGDVPVACVFK